MRNINTLTPREYILYNLFYAITAMIWYRAILFAALPWTTISWSKLILWIAVIVLTACGCILTFRKRRNYISLLANILLPYEIYTVFVYNTYIPKLVWGVTIFSIVISAAFFILAIAPDKQAAQREPAAFERHLKHGLLGARTIAAVCMLILLLPLGTKLLFGHGLINTTIPPVRSASQAGDWTVKNNIDTVRLLKEEDWSKLDTQEKLNVLGVILNIEIRYLGLNHELYLKSAMLDTNIAAHYTHSNYEIAIDIDHLQTSSAESILNSLCHECYHSYQHQMIDLYNASPEEYRDMLLFQYVEDYIEEFTDYSDGSEDVIGYYYQTVEIAARNYALQATDEYYELIAEYTEDLE